ncbi:MAG: arsenate reductase (glutaredoxin) [Cyclobacteriaceae bacterium]|nr:arsenate reductase (glutaredoxin) [Cyclobacteriaceae bacterium]
MLKIYHNPRCSKSRQTLQLIKDSDTEVEIIEYLKTPPTEDELRNLITSLNLPIEYLIRKNEEIYKTKFKGKELSDDEWIKILVENPKLLERPIVVNREGETILGRPPENVGRFL